MTDLPLFDNGSLKVDSRVRVKTRGKWYEGHIFRIWSHGAKPITVHLDVGDSIVPIDVERERCERI